MEKPRRIIFNSYSIPNLAVILVFVIDLTIIFTTHQNWNSSMQRYVPLKDHIDKVNNELAVGHLWLEEAITGDATIDINKQVFFKFQNAFDNTIKFIKNNRENFTSTEDKGIISTLEHIANPLLYNFNQLARLRWNNVHKSVIGSDMDQEFDSDFNALQEELQKINTLILRLLRDEFEERNTYFTIILYLFITVNILVFAVLFFTMRKIKHAEKAIQQQKDVLAYKAHYDNLTGLPNRELFLDRLSQAIKSAQRDQTLAAILFIDLDRFKKINDSLGHHIGDEVLKVVSSRLLRNTRETDSLARLGGDEFTMIFCGLTSTNQIIHIVNKLIEEMNQPITIGDHTLYATISLGISLYPNDGEDTMELLKNADAAMYKAKDEGRNTYCFYTQEMTDRAINRIVLENELRAAIKNQNFIIYYQPQVDGKTDQMIGMEALIRWQHKEHGIISPADFIPLAEETGLIIELDQWTMKTAMKQMVEWYSQGLNPGILALNLSVKQLQQENFTYLLQTMLDETSCKPEWIELEVTEGQIMIDPVKAIAILQKISDMGIELAIDDFGTGYSSLSYLKQLPIDKLKIDRSFVQPLPDSNDDAAIAKAIISLAQNLSLSVIAEGVETVEQRDFLVDNGCTNIQGYFYSKPLPASEIEKQIPAAHT